MYTKSGPTLIELSIGVIFAVVVIGMVVGVVNSCSGGDHESADKNAKAWASQMGFKDAKITCLDYDTDNDGYVSCSIAQKNKDGEVRITPIECSGKFSFNKGCRSPKATVNNEW